MGWDTAFLSPPCPAFAQGSVERHGENRKTTVRSKQGDIVKLTSKAIADKYKPKQEGFPIDDIIKQNEFDIKLFDETQPYITKPTMSKENEEMKGYYKIKHELFWTVIPVIVGGAFFLGSYFGSNKFDREKNDLFLENTKLQRELEYVYAKALEDSIKSAYKIKQLTNSNKTDSIK